MKLYPGRYQPRAPLQSHGTPYAGDGQGEVHELPTAEPRSSRHESLALDMGRRTAGPLSQDATLPAALPPPWIATPRGIARQASAMGDCAADKPVGLPASHLGGGKAGKGKGRGR